MNFIEGEVLLFNKPKSWTSFDVVKKVRYKLKYKHNIKKIKVGHAGTLDPLADGLMIVCTGKATKKIEELQGHNKEYIATIEIGKTTPSYDLETEFDKEFNTDHVNEEIVKVVLQSFIGEQQQVPPIFSAKKINGKRAYEMARKGEEVKMRPNIIHISKIELLEFNNPVIRILVTCSKGTYIRSLARDIGEKLNCGAYLKGLTRTAIGPFKLSHAEDIEQFEQKENKISE